MAYQGRGSDNENATEGIILLAAVAYRPIHIRLVSVAIAIEAAAAWPYVIGAAVDGAAVAAATGAFALSFRWGRSEADRHQGQNSRERETDEYFHSSVCPPKITCPRNLPSKSATRLRPRA